MSTNNLYHYIKTGAFLHEVRNKPQAIIWEKIPADIQFNIQHIALADLGYDFSAGGTVSKKLAEYTSVYLILDTIAMISCQELLASLSATTSLVLINLGVGISGVQNKHTFETNDYAIVGDRLPIFEPLDTQHFTSVLSASDHGSMYCRVVHDEIPDGLFTAQHMSIYQESYIPMIQFGYTGIAGSIITQPGLIVPITQALQHLKTEHGIGFDLYIAAKPTGELTEQTMQSIQHSSKIVVIHDQLSHEGIQNIYEKRFRDSVQQKDTTILYKKPDYSKITTIFPEYMYEQIGYTPEAIAHYLLSLI